METKWANLKKMEEETFSKIVMGKADISIMSKMKGSAYWLEKDCSGLSAQYFSLSFPEPGSALLGQDMGPSTHAFQELEEEAKEKYGLTIFTAWTFAEDERLRYQYDHAGANETSIVMAVWPELVDFSQVKKMKAI